MMHDQWVLAENPKFANRNPGDSVLEPICHDRSNHLSIICICGAEMHIHETQIANYKDHVIGAQCKGCGDPMEFPPNYLHQAFAAMRAQGWIA